MSLLILFGGEAAATPVETTAAVGVAFTAGAMYDVEVIVDVLTTSSIGLALETAVPSYTRYRCPPTVADLAFSAGTAYEMSYGVDSTAAVALAFSGGVTGWTRTRQPNVVIPITFTPAFGYSTYTSDSIDLEVVWDQKYMRQPVGEATTYTGIIDIAYKALSTADDDDYPALYRIRTNSEPWSEWLPVVFVSSGGKHHPNGYFLVSNYSIAWLDYGYHTIYIELKDDDDNIIDEPLSLGVQYLHPHMDHGEPPTRLRYDIRRVERTGTATATRRGDMRRVEK